MSIGIAATIGMIATVAAIVLLYVKVLPKKYDGKLDNKYLQWLHNYFNFKRLYIEDILKLIREQSVSGQRKKQLTIY